MKTEKTRQAAIGHRASAAILIAVLMLAPTAGGYSVFTHEELIDLAWRNSIRPLLLARFPHSTDAQLRQAHAYAYGGCLIQDIGYYPFGNELFSDLTHYVRSGDFVNALLRNASTLDEFAFAIGALSHYVGDNIGHSQAINPATSEDFPKLEKKFGPSVSYDESPHGHIRTEFGFDIGQLSKRNFAPPAYMESIGFRVPSLLVQRAFMDTYGFDVRAILGKARPALRSYRSSVRHFIPRFAEAEVVLHGREFLPDAVGPDYQLFSSRLEQAVYERHWSKRYENPGFVPHLLAILIRILPKIGPISDLAIKIPDKRTEDWYIRSVNHAVDRYLQLLAELKADPKRELALENRDLDTGDSVRPGAYPRTDQTYAKLLKRVASKPSTAISPALRDNILSFYSDPNAPNTTKKDKKAWRRVQSEIEILKQKSD